MNALIWIILTIMYAAALVMSNERTRKKAVRDYKNSLEYDYYILAMVWLVEPVIHGPYERTECNTVVTDMHNDPKNSENSYVELKVTEDAEIDT